jgi:hypothetical protein
MKVVEHCMAQLIWVLGHRAIEENKVSNQQERILLRRIFRFKREAATADRKKVSL